MKIAALVIVFLLKCHQARANGPFDLCFYHLSSGEEFIQCGELKAYRNEKPNNNLQEIEKIHIGWNTTMPELRFGLFSSFTRLKVLHLSNSHIQRLDKRAFYNMEQLTELSLFNNEIIEVDSSVFKYLTSLRVLDLGTNKITGLLDFIFHNLLDLEELVLSWNMISTVTMDLFYGLNNLRKLNLAGNSLKSLPENAFACLTNLIGLDLSYNDLAELPVGLFNNQSEMQMLNLESNQLQCLRQGLFRNTVELLYLDISNNFITRVNGSLLNNTVVEMLKFERNLVTEIDVAELLKQAQFLEELYFDHNPWKCHALRNAIQYLNESEIYFEPGVYFAHQNINGILCDKI
ncbi:carboxypeptidase N subunit 2-like [Photinus pyralis]|nr:carboxypeptidase N subunit 2-like [Photinus pyralis]